MQILALIPARSGSKSIVDKNVRLIAGKPLLAWSIEQARASRLVTRVLVSTDSDRYADLARQFGAETPFRRPAAIAGDLSTDLETFAHALAWLDAHEGYRPDICLHLRPTHPVRRHGVIDDVLQVLIRDPALDAVRTVAEVLHPPYKMWRRDDAGRLQPLLDLPGIAEPWNEPRQRLPKTYLHTGNVDAVRTSVITQKHSMSGTAIFGFLEPESFDIDTDEEFHRAEQALRASAGRASAPPDRDRERAPC
ncbi:MAG: acylneuraminate cytidylyltransferase family protein [Lentisphaerae bacterium]|nr:acylneuraminate cytidylyltransferase family protein [Lentisphaerota bacterium]